MIRAADKGLYLRNERTVVQNSKRVGAWTYPVEKKTCPHPKKVAIVATVIGILAFTLAALLVPSLPVATSTPPENLPENPSENLAAAPTLISRAQAWLISFPSLFDLETLWTGERNSPSDPTTSSGQPPRLTSAPTGPFERAIALAGSAVWLAVAYFLGSAILRWPMRRDLFKVSKEPSEKADAMTRIGLAVATGHCTLLIAIAMHTVIFPPNFIPDFIPDFIPSWLLPIAILFAAVVPWMRELWNPSSRIAQSTAESSTKSFTEPYANTLEVSTSKFDPPHPRDPSWLYPWSRRLIGVTFLGCLALGFLGLLGSTLPSYDIDVRENDWLIIKNDIDPSARSNPNSSTSLNSLPAARGIPALGLARLASSIGLLSPGKATDEAQVRLLRIMLIGQCIDAWMFLLAVAILVRLGIEHYGALAGWTAGLLILGHPGLHELSRLGLGAGLASLVITLSFTWLIHGLRFSDSHRNPDIRYSPKLLAASLCVLAAWGSFPAAMLATLPLLTKELMHISIPSFGKLLATDLKGPPTKRNLQPAYMKWSFSLLSLALIAAIVASWLRAPWILPVAGLPYSERSFRSSIEILSRMLLSSASNSIAILPLALGGFALCRDRRASLGCLCVGTWWLMWCVLGGRLERGWVIAVLWLALPAACGIQQLQNFVGRWFTAPLCWLILTWTCVCIPTWPYCDQRLLASLDQYIPMHLRDDYSRGGETIASDANAYESSKAYKGKPSENKPSENKPSEGNTRENALAPSLDQSSFYPAYSDWVESERKGDAQDIRPPDWLVLGTSDVFFWKVRTHTRPWWHEDADIPDFSLLEHLRVGYILVDYEGLHSRIEQRERWARRHNQVTDEQSHDELATLRAHIEELVRKGIIERCDPWGNASQAECYRVLSYNP